MEQLPDRLWLDGAQQIVFSATTLQYSQGRLYLTQNILYSTLLLPKFFQHLNSESAQKVADVIRVCTPSRFDLVLALFVLLRDILLEVLNRGCAHG